MLFTVGNTSEKIQTTDGGDTGWFLPDMQSSWTSYETTTKTVYWRGHKVSI